MHEWWLMPADQIGVYMYTCTSTHTVASVKIWERLSLTFAWQKECRPLCFSCTKVRMYVAVCPPHLAEHSRFGLLIELLDFKVILWVTICHGNKWGSNFIHRKHLKGLPSISGYRYVPAHKQFLQYQVADPMNINWENN